MNYNSELIKWSPDFACGIKKVDKQHKDLVEMLNDMFNHVSLNEEQEKIYFNSIIKRLIKYVKNHFKTEEKIMLKTNFTGYIAHKEAHEDFVLNILKIVNDFTEGNRFNLLDLTQFLKTWILNHIAIMDRQYFIHIKNIL